MESPAEFVRRAVKAGAAERARKRAGIGLSEASHGLKVSESTVHRWERGVTVPANGENLKAFARFLRQVRVDEDPEMREGPQTALAA